MPDKTSLKFELSDKLKAEMRWAEEFSGITHEDFQRELALEEKKASDAWEARTRRENKLRTREARENRDVEEIISPSSLPISSEEPNRILPAKKQQIPEWYNKINPNGLAMKQLMKKKDPTTRQAITALSSMKDCINRCEREHEGPQQDKYHDELRDHIHKAEFLEVNELIVRKVLILDNGLTRIFEPKPGVDFPWDLKLDAVQLYNRWASKIFSVDLLRGITLSKSKQRNADSIDKTWKDMHPMSPKFHGNGDLIIGQWWPTQLCTMRDGAHGSPQAGISGDKGSGAYSIVLSGGHAYADVDNGDEIWYSGTDSRDATPTENTQRMIESADIVKQPVRVIRSWNLQKSNPYRPLRGFRYDGLYEVVGYRVLDASKAIYNFHLVRCPGQFPIRFEDNPARRPTRWEIEQYDKLRDEGRGVGSEQW